MLDEVLRSERPYPLEGSGLNALLNPVLVDGERGWADLVGGGHAVFEEVFPCTDFFDFATQHSVFWSSIVSFLRQHGAPVPTHGEIVLAIESVGRRNARDILSRFSTWWTMSRQAETLLATLGPILDNRAAWHAVESDEFRRCDRTEAAELPEDMIERLRARSLTAMQRLR